MKKVMKALVVLVIFVVVLVMGINMFLGPIVKTGLTKAGPVLLGTPIELKTCSFALLRGHLSLSGLVMGSPEGFKADNVFELGEVTVDLDPHSLLSDTIHIKRIYINDPGITYEQALTGSNLGKIMENLGGDKDGALEETKEEKPEEKKETKPGKKVIIDEVVIESGSVKVAVAALGGNGVTVPLPTLTLKDIGKEKGGTSPAEAVGLIIGAVFKGVMSVVGSVAGLAVDGTKAVVGVAGAAGGATVDLLKDAGGGTINAIKSVGGLLGGDAEQKGPGDGSGAAE